MMKKYHLIVVIFVLLVTFFYLEHEFIMTSISSLIGFQFKMASNHVNYLTGIFTVLIIAYLIKHQEG